MSGLLSYRQICELMEGRKLTDEEFAEHQAKALMVLGEIELKISDSEDIHAELEERDG
jgi:hypothetical protein